MQKQSRIPGADLETVSALLRQLAPEAEQQMAFVNEPSGRICSWGIPLAECWGVRLPRDCTDAVPAPLQLMEVPEGDYLVFEHGPFDLQTENSLVEAKSSVRCAISITRPPAAVWIPHPVVCSILCMIVCVSGSISGLLFDFEKTVEISSRW